MNIDLIKRAVEDAEGFSLYNKLGRMSIYTPCGGYAFSFKKPLSDDFWKGAGSLLLTRAIDGINKNHESLVITQGDCFIDVINQDSETEKTFFIAEYDDNYDSMREAVLEHVYREMIK